jgi:hypothetical protein
MWHMGSLSVGISILRGRACGRAKGHVWTAPAVQEESDYQRSVRVRSSYLGRRLSVTRASLAVPPFTIALESVITIIVITLTVSSRS